MIRALQSWSVHERGTDNGQPQETGKNPLECGFVSHILLFKTFTATVTSTPQLESQSNDFSFLLNNATPHVSLANNMIMHTMTELMKCENNSQHFDPIADNMTRLNGKLGMCDMGSTTKKEAKRKNAQTKCVSRCNFE